MKRIALSFAFLLAGLSFASAQAVGTDNASPDASSKRGAGVGGIGSPADGPSSNQPGGAAQPNSAATPGPGTAGSPGNVSVTGTQAK